MPVPWRRSRRLSMNSMNKFASILLFLAIDIGTSGVGIVPLVSAQPPAKEGTHERAVEPYLFDTCPISGKKLGAMGDPVVKAYDGREVRFCCTACPEKFESDKAASLSRLDDRIIKDQGPLYPPKASVVSGKDLPGAPFEFVYRNRLVRLGAEGERAEFLKDPARYMA